jgi:hypothetical protein
MRTARTSRGSFKRHELQADVLGVPAGTRINHALWAFRAAFALIALGLLVVIFHQRSFRPAPAPTPPARFATARGATAVGESMTMRFDRPGHPVWFRTRLHARCTNPAYPGRHWTWSWGWWPADGDPTP